MIYKPSLRLAEACAALQRLADARAGANHLITKREMPAGTVEDVGPQAVGQFGQSEGQDAPAPRRQGVAGREEDGQHCAGPREEDAGRNAGKGS